MAPLFALDETVQWKSGTELNRKAQVAISGQWDQVPVRSLLYQLSQGQKIALFVDRRVDPNATVTLAVRNLTWDQLLLEISGKSGYCFCQLDNVYYFGPNKACNSLPTIYAKLMVELAKRRQQLDVKWRTPTKISWPRYSQPRSLIESFANYHRIQIYEVEQIPHDLWPEFDAPEIPLVLQALLLAAGFDKSIAISKSGSKMKIVDYPAVSTGTFSVGHLKSPRTLAKKLKSSYPQLKLQSVGRSKIELTGPIELFQPAIRELIGLQKAVGIVENSDARFSFQFKGTRGSLLATIARQMDVNFAFAPDTGELLSDYLERDFKDVAADEIIKAALESTNLKYRLNTAELKILK